MELGYLKKILRLARENDFLLIMDECYSDIWRITPNRGFAGRSLLEKESKNTESLDLLSNLVVLNSLSKRSGAAGLRAGFMVGDKTVIKQYSKLVANGGSLVPTPLLEVAADLYSDRPLMWKQFDPIMTIIFG